MEHFEFSNDVFQSEYKKKGAKINNFIDFNKMSL